MTRIRQENGFTLTELLVGAVLMIIVMTATLNVLDHVTLISARTNKRVDVQDSARRTSRELARALRNSAASSDLTAIIERADPYDLVFRAVDKARTDMGSNTGNLKRVRYCLDDRDRDRAKLIEQTQRWNTPTAPGMPPSSACPGPQWDAQRLVADRITNRSGGDRPLWVYGRNAAGQITSIKVNLFMNADPTTRPSEVGLETGVYLRNQNRAPTALFSAATTGLRHVLLNGSTSSDPEGDPLDYFWFANGVQVGRGMIFDYAAPSGGRRDFYLEVRDPSGLTGRSVTRTVVLP